MNENGHIKRNMARLMCKGYAQVEGINFEETCSPMAILESIRMFLGFAWYNIFKVYQMDVKLSFLNGEIEEEEYIGYNEGFKFLEDKDNVCKLKKELYGLKHLLNLGIPNLTNKTTRFQKRSCKK